MRIKGKKSRRFKMQSIVIFVHMSLEPIVFVITVVTPESFVELHTTTAIWTIVFLDKFRLFFTIYADMTLIWLCKVLANWKIWRSTASPITPRSTYLFSIDNFNFIDSLQFMNASLEKMVSNLAKDGDNKFPTLKKYIDSDKVRLLLRKGFNPYGLHIKNWTANFITEGSFTMNKFQTRTTSTQRVCLKTSCVTIWVITMICIGCLMFFSLLMCLEISEAFCLKAYNLDPCHFYTSLGLAWQACLKMTDVKLELLNDPVMYLFVEEDFMVEFRG